MSAPKKPRHKPHEPDCVGCRLERLGTEADLELMQSLGALLEALRLASATRAILPEDVQTIDDAWTRFRSSLAVANHHRRHWRKL